MLLKKIAHYLIMGLFCFTANFSMAQDQRVADSLVHIYQENKLEGIDKLKLLDELSFNELNDQILQIKYADEMIVLAKLNNDSLFLYRGYYSRGVGYQRQGELNKAISDFFRSLKIANNIKNKNSIGWEGTSYMSIGSVYNNMGNHVNSEKYYSIAIEKIRITKDSISLGSVLLNAGDASFNNNQYEKALQYFEEAGIIFENIGFKIGTAYNLGNIGMVYAEQGKDVIAEKNINEAILILEEIKDYYPISVYLTYMSEIYLRKKDYITAFNYAERSLELAQKYNLIEQIRDANHNLFELHELTGNYKDSNIFLKNYYIYRDSIVDIKTVEELADLRTKYEIEQNQKEANLKIAQKQIEVDLLDQQKKNQQLISLAIGIGLLLIIIVAIGLYRRNNFVNKAKLLVEKEKEKSDSLLLNILPEQTAEELKYKGKVQAKRFESVSVMFTDFKGFTQNSANLSPEKLVESVNYYYSKFDDIIDKYGLEKIKTMGDAYMCAGGLPFPTKDHPIQMVEAALEIAAFVNESKKTDPDAMSRFDIRIGINTGPVVAGVVGKKKFAYDIWGDTVNIASRMESNSEPGKVNISDNTYQLIKDQYQCSYRGEIDAKNKGMMKMYFVEGILQNQTSNAGV
ncbi:adenylate/guanylate cyclase domain-containing protein [Lutimonas halocynthiae]|uniref:adenylate/guanylate cyclase domain-containing protein n=1 Tax=Lutimonas halocynthiae TaxID=1446477 RepID=UPI0025B4CA81|nr:adenylate/guanylate cyclase domain-containing protein [Lutimonas halocynthiae]MDN3642996.1 adenylate/guanylate cyclase domain-containing protein [Lutimonas halocynthiae]